MKKIIVLIMTLLLLIGCTEVEFDGSRTGNDELFSVDAKMLNSQLEHNLDLTVQESIIVDAEVTKGVMSVRIFDASDEEIYAGHIDGKFTFELFSKTAGNHKIVVEGDGAVGEITFRKNQ